MEVNSQASPITGKQEVLLVKNPNLDYCSTLVIPKSVEAKIRHLCAKFPSNEWCGYLFTKHTGDLEEHDLTVTAVDILLMGLGSMAATEFEDGPDVAVYMARHPELIGCKRMHIHSHNSMQAFISGVDAEDLRKEGNNSINMVSLVVNNAGNYVAAMTRKIKSTRQIHDCYSYENLDNKEVEKCSDYTESDVTVEYFMMTVEVHKVEDFDDLDKRIDELSTKSAQNTFASTGWNTFKSMPTDYKKATPVVHNIVSNNAAVDMDIVDEMLLKLITGNVFINKLTKLNIESWCTTMLPKLCKRTFSKEDSLEEYCDTFVDLIMQQFLMDKLDQKKVLSDDEGFSIETYLEAYAKALVDEIHKLPGATENKYLYHMVSSLTGYFKFDYRK